MVFPLGLAIPLNGRRLLERAGRLPLVEGDAFEFEKDFVAFGEIVLDRIVELLGVWKDLCVELSIASGLLFGSQKATAFSRYRLVFKCSFVLALPVYFKLVGVPVVV